MIFPTPSLHVICPIISVQCEKGVASVKFLVISAALILLSVDPKLQMSSIEHYMATSGMEKIPGPRTKTQKFIFLLPL